MLGSDLVRNPRADRTACLDLTLLGSFQARHLASGRALRLPRKKNRALLAYLAVPPGRQHSRAALTALLWGDLDAEGAHRSFRQALFVLKATLVRARVRALRTEDDAVRLDPALVNVDVATFEELLARRTPGALAEAMHLYRGDFLAGLDVAEAPFEEWLVGERERLRALAVRALETLLAHHTKVGRDDEALDWALRLLALDPLQESVHRAVMRLHAARGRFGLALRQYQQCVDSLQRELGSEPSSATRELYREILRRPSTEQPPSEGLHPQPSSGGRRVRRRASSRGTPLVARRAELGALREALSNACRGHAQFVSVLGEAGIGKTRLIAELTAVAQRRGARVLWGPSHESARAIAFGPWIDAVRNAEALGERAVQKDLPAVWKAELSRLFPELGEPPLARGPVVDLGRLFEAAARLLEALASRRPLVLVLEDLHWADETSVRLLASLAHRLRRGRLLVLISARTEDIEPEGALRGILDELEEARLLRSVTLWPLDQADTEELVRTLVQGARHDPDAAALSRQVWALTHGNPFVVVEAVRARLDRSAVDIDEDLPLPDRVREAIERRLRRLSRPAGHAAAIAAVVGQPCVFGVLWRASGLPDLEAAAAVEELVRRRVLESTDSGFQFTHDRIREVAYARLDAIRRRLLHGRVATALAEEHAAELESKSAVLAHHALAGELWTTAVGSCRRAARVAERRGARTQAAGFLEAALAALAHLSGDPDTVATGIDLRFELRNALDPIGDNQRVLRTLDEALRLAEGADDRPRIARACSFLAHALRLEGEPLRAVEMGERALALAEALGELGLRVQIYDDLGQAYEAAGAYAESVRMLRRNVELLQGERVFEHFGKPGPSGVWSRCALALVLAEVGEFHEARELAEEGARVARAVENRVGLVLMQFVAGFVALGQGDLEVARGKFEEGIALSSGIEGQQYERLCRGYLGYVHALNGRRADGIALLEETLEQTAAARRPEWMVHLGEAHLLAGDEGEAARLARAALDGARRHGQRSVEARALLLRARIAGCLPAPDIAGAEAFYREALALAAHLGLRPLVAQAHLGLASLYQESGEREKEAENLGTARTLFDEMDMRCPAVNQCSTNVPR
ncbi:MAG TPA: AAA family ATPase [Candidatus Bathyarchaeia archaeon]|nr:AAA family ATPase [Candidatus Bathyarchaeia archaeon]